MIPQMDSYSPKTTLVGRQCPLWPLVMRLIASPFSAETRPSTMTTTLSPSFLKLLYRLTSSISSFASSHSYSKRDTSKPPY
jgi:hypothetical protein